MPENIVEQVKDYADELGINVTSAYTVLLNQALSQRDILNNLPELFKMYNHLNEVGLVDEYKKDMKKSS